MDRLNERDRTMGKYSILTNEEINIEVAKAIGFKIKDITQEDVEKRALYQYEYGKQFPNSSDTLEKWIENFSKDLGKRALFLPYKPCWFTISLTSDATTWATIQKGRFSDLFEEWATDIDAILEVIEKHVKVPVSIYFDEVWVISLAYYYEEVDSHKKVARELCEQFLEYMDNGGK